MQEANGLSAEGRERLRRHRRWLVQDRDFNAAEAGRHERAADQHRDRVEYFNEQITKVDAALNQEVAGRA